MAIDKSKYNPEDIQRLADLFFLSQNTGVSGAVYDVAKEAVGIDTSGSPGSEHTDVTKLLSAFGYTPGGQKTFYGSNEALDPGAKLLKEQWEKARDDEEVTNSSAHNKAWLKIALKERGIPFSETAAVGLDKAFNSEEEADLDQFDRLTELGRDPDMYSYTIFDIGSSTPVIEEEEEDPWVPPDYAGGADVSDTSSAESLEKATRTTPLTTTYQSNPTDPYEYSQPVAGGGNTTGSSQPSPTGTFRTPSQTAGLSAVPASVTVSTDVAGFTPEQLTETMPGTGGVANSGVLLATYRNKFGQTILVTEIGGKPATYVPPGYSKVSAAAEGGFMRRGYADGGNVQSQTAEYSSVPVYNQNIAPLGLGASTQPANQAPVMYGTPTPSTDMPTASSSALEAAMPTVSATQPVSAEQPPATLTPEQDLLDTQTQDAFSVAPQADTTMPEATTGMEQAIPTASEDTASMPLEDTASMDTEDWTSIPIFERYKSKQEQRIEEELEAVRAAIARGGKNEDGTPYGRNGKGFHFRGHLTKDKEKLEGDLALYQNLLKQTNDLLNPPSTLAEDGVTEIPGEPVKLTQQQRKMARDRVSVYTQRLEEIERDLKRVNSQMGSEIGRNLRQLQGDQRRLEDRLDRARGSKSRDLEHEARRFAENLQKFLESEAQRPVYAFERQQREYETAKRRVTTAENALSYGSFDDYYNAKYGGKTNFGDLGPAGHKAAVKQGYDYAIARYPKAKRQLTAFENPNSWFSRYKTSMEETGKGILLPNQGPNAPEAWVSGLSMRYSDVLKMLADPSAPLKKSERFGKHRSDIDILRLTDGKVTLQEILDMQAARVAAIAERRAKAAANKAASGAAQGGLMQSGYAEGGMSEDKMLEAKFRIASMNGYQGPKTNAALNAFANSSPSMTAKFNAIGAALAKGGYMQKGYANGGLETSLEDFQGMQQNLVTQTMQPIQAPVAQIQPTTQDFIPTTAGQAAPVAPFAQAATVPTTAQAALPAMTPASVMQAATAAPQVQAATDQMQAAQGQLQPQAQVQAAQQADTSVAGMQAAQGTAIMMDNPVQRQIQQGELVSGAANAQTAAAFTEQVQAATATPTKQATVQGQLESLMQQFEGGNTPPWAAASMRNATAILAARGLGASSMAGQAVIQAAMEAALPIAQMDAQVQAQFEAQNLSNRQQRAMMAAQQRAEFLGMEFTQEFQARVQNSARIGDIANMNFTAEQQIALENSRAANTVNLQNLNNRQAMVMAEAAALSQLDMQNLSNRQQAAVQNAQNFLQMDLTNLSNEQQATMFKAQSVIQSLFTDQAAENAAKQFNASSENQTNQFFASLAANTSQFNAVQQNAMDQFNVDAVNTLRQFNSQIQQQRDLFNAQNGLVVAQANAQWRQNIATLNTASQNQSNMDFAKTINALTSTNLDQIWQRERDMLSMAYQSAESNADRALSITLQKMAADATIEAAKFQADVQADIAKGQGWADVFTSVIGLI